MAKFIYIEKIKPDARWHNSFCVHNYHELIVILSGLMHVSGRGQEFVLRPGEAAIYPAGVCHYEHSDPEQPVESCCIVFEDSCLTGRQIIRKPQIDPILRSMASTLYDCFAANREIPFADDYLNLMLKIFNTATVSDTPAFVNEANRFMYLHLSSAVTLDDIAAAAGKSKFQFIRQYQQSTGVSPIHALYQMRCSEAVSLLKYTTLSIKEIAFRTGFTDPGHFSRRIKLFSGKSPSQLRKSEQNTASMPSKTAKKV